jgi:hypothetical protein
VWVPVSVSEFAGVDGGEVEVEGEWEGARGMEEMARSWERGRLVAGGGGRDSGDWDMRSEEHSLEEAMVDGWVVGGGDAGLAGCGSAF